MSNPRALPAVIEAAECHVLWLFEQADSENDLERSEGYRLAARELLSYITELQIAMKKGH